MKIKLPSSTKAKSTSLAVLLVSVFLLSALGGAQFVSKVSAAYTEYTGTLDGAGFALRFPDNWNGMLIVICRGYSATVPTALSSLGSPGVSSMLNQGFAVAASNYGAAGMCVQKGMNTTYQLTKYVISTYNVTGKVFLYGLSMGGCIVLLLGEKYPSLYSGVLDVFGVKDLKDTYTTFAEWANLSDADLTAELIALTAPVPPLMFTLQTLRAFYSGVALDIGLETGGTPATQPKAYEDDSPTYHANITIPVITVHGTSDALVPFYQTVMYQTAVASAGRSNLYRVYDVIDGQHMSPSVYAQLPARFAELVAWSDTLTGSDWPMFRLDLQHTGYSTSPAPNTNQTLWNYTTSEAVRSSPAVVDGVVYVGSNDHKVYALNAANGASLWNYTTGEPVESSPAVVDGIVYVGSNDNKTYALNATTGALIWNYTTGRYVTSSPTVVGGSVYVGSYDKKVYALNATNGASMWNYTTGAEIASSPAVADGRIYVGSSDTKVYCLNASTGASIWNYTTSNSVTSSPAVADGRVYVGSWDASVYCLNASTGARIWQYADVSILSSPAVVDGKVFVGQGGGYPRTQICALDAATGASIWNYTTSSQVTSSPAVADGKVYVGSFDSKVYCLNAATGALLWSYTTGGAVYSSPAVANGVVYVGSLDRKVYAFSASPPIPEGLTSGVIMLLSSIAALISTMYFRKQPRITK